MLACRTNIVAISPQLATPVRAPQTRKLRIQLSRSDTLDHVHHSCRSVARRTTDKQVHMVFLNRQCFDLPIPRRTDLANQFLQPSCDIANQDPTTVARNPDKVIGQPVYCMSATTCLHSADYSISAPRGPLRGPHVARRYRRRASVSAFGGPAFLPAASGGVSSRRIT